MRIDSSTIGMESARSYRSSLSVQTKFESSVSNNTTTGSQLTNSTLGGNRQDSLDAFNVLSFGTKGLATSKKSAEEKFRKLHEMAIQSIIERIFGRRCKNKPEDFSDTDVSPQGNEITYELVPAKLTNEFTFSEYEETSFSMYGNVTTEDGQNISIGISVAMTRSFTQTYSQNFAAFMLRETDPLTLNFEGNAAELSDLKFLFDLDCDGEAESISMLKGGSGFLALDKNGDGVINDGSELFGTKSGDGFKDLAKYDEDGNGWIDENDSIFEKLRIWCKGPDGTDQLYTLKDKDVGALYLGNVNTDFELKSMLGDTNGHIRKTGMFLFENGSAGTLQHIDIA